MQLKDQSPPSNRLYMLHLCCCCCCCCLFVFAAPARILEVLPGDVTRNEGSDVQFSCIVQASHNVRVTWRKDGRNLNSEQFDLSCTFVPGQCNGTLVIRDITSSDSGNYTCHAGNSVASRDFSGTASSTPVSLTVRGKCLKMKYSPLKK